MAERLLTRESSGGAGRNYVKLRGFMIGLPMALRPKEGVGWFQVLASRASCPSRSQLSSRATYLPPGRHLAAQRDKLNASRY